jgi:hypothetical protein
MVISLSNREKALARHALGLPNQWGQSYRNRFVAANAPGDYDVWLSLKGKGAAGSMVADAGKTRFWLTFEGAKAALESGERLDPEDFPRASSLDFKGE